jgi:hypothetical protein
MRNILILISYSALLVWLLPPIKQFRTKFFLYFFILAISDPVNIILYRLYSVNVWQCHIFFSSLTIFSLIEINNRKALLFFIPLILVVISVLFGMSIDTMQNIAALNILLAAMIIAKDFIIQIKETEKINIFYIVLLFYNISTVIKILFFISYSKTGYLYFFLTNIFQILIAVYFSIYNVNNSKKFSLNNGSIPREV